MKVWIGVARTLAAAGGMLCLLLAILLCTEAVHVITTPSNRIAAEYHFGAEHFGMDWVYRSPTGFVIDHCVWAVLLTVAAIGLARAALGRRSRSWLLGLSIVAAFVCETVLRSYLGE